MMKIRNGDHDHTEIKTIKRGKKKAAKSRSKAHSVPKLIRPQLSKPNLSLAPKAMPKLTPKTVPKLIPKIENIPPNDDAENIIVDILD